MDHGASGELPVVRSQGSQPDSLVDARVTRRSFLKLGSLVGASGLVLANDARASRMRAILGGPSIITANLTRREDMLCVGFTFYNFTLSDGPTPRLNRGGGFAYIRVDFPPQAIMEQAWPEYSGDPKLPTPPLGSRAAEPTRLVFAVPENVTEIPFTVEGVLNWSGFPMRVAPAANLSRVPNQRIIRVPAAEETAIEAPYGLVMSPHSDHSWWHPSSPRTFNGRTDLWHTQLKAPDNDGPPAKPTLRAIWMRSFDRGTPPRDTSDPFDSSLSNHDRWEIIRLTSDWRTFSDPKPVAANLFALSALGASVDIEGTWSPAASTGLSIQEWRHQAVLGRDNFVKVVYKGYLFPFGHKASLTKITQRRLQIVETGPQKGKVVAYLRQRKFITVLEPTLRYSPRDVAFSSLQIHTLQTPDLEPPSESTVLGGEKAFWPRVDNADFKFLISGRDRDSNLIWFTAPLIFVKAAYLGRAREINSAHRRSSSDRRVISMNGQDIAMSPSPPGEPGKSALPTMWMEFRGTERAGTPPWRPGLVEASIRLKAVEELKGQAISRTVAYDPTYIDQGFAGKNQDAQVFLRLLNPVNLDFADGADADKAGGLFTPNTKLTAFSRKMGPLAAGAFGALPPTKFDPSKFFKGAKLLGGIDLADIVKVLNTVEKAPQMLTRKIHEAGNQLLPPEQIVTEFHWSVKGTNEMKSDPAQLFEPLPNASLELTATFITKVKSPGPPEYRIVGELKNFKIHMIGKPGAFLVLTFNRLKFTSATGQSPDVDVDIEEVAFAGVLTFVNELKDFMDFGGNGLSIDVTPSKIEANYTLAIPTVSVGIFTLANLSLAAGVEIPFTGKPVSARFSFCRPDAQFLLTYTIFGGGGFVQIAVGSDEKGELGIELLEIGLEFGASASLDLGVASGGVQIMAGIYMRLGKVEGCAQPVAQLSGYVRLSGELDVLGIVNISVEFKMTLTYDFNENVVWGQATLVVEVDVLMVSKSVELTVERRFGGGGGGSALCAPTARGAAALLAPSPAAKITFGDLMDAPTPGDLNDIWEEEYGAAFSSAAFV